MKELTDREFLFRLLDNEEPSETWPEGRLHVVAPMKSWADEKGALFGPNIYDWAVQHLRPSEWVRLMSPGNDDRLYLERHGNGSRQVISGHVEDESKLWVMIPGVVTEYTRPVGLKQRLSIDTVKLPAKPYGLIPTLLNAKIHLQTYGRDSCVLGWEECTGGTPHGSRPITVGLPSTYAYALWHLDRGLGHRFESHILGSSDNDPADWAENNAYVTAYFEELAKLNVYRAPKAKDGFRAIGDYWLSSVFRRPMFSGPDYSPGAAPRSLVDLPIFHRDGGKIVEVGDRVWRMWRKMLDLPLEFESPRTKAEAYAEFIVEGRKLFVEDLGYVIKT